MKSNKLLKKINIKLEKAYNILKKNEPLIEISTEKTNNLLILNGGLLNEINKEQIYELFSFYGNIQSIIMRIGKSYSFISFNDEISASKAVDNLNGKIISVDHEILKRDIRFYLYYVIRVPEDEENVKLYSLPSGFQIFEDYISEETEQKLLDCIVWDEKNGDTLKHRQVKHYGARFDYLTNNVDRSGAPIDAFPSICFNLLRRMMEKGIIHQMPDQLTINQYQSGQGIPSHVDTHSAFEDEIIVLSLQSQIIMDFTNPDGDSIPVLLRRRSLAVMSGESRYLWSHGITPRHYDVTQLPHNESVDSQKAHSGLTSYKRGVRTSFTFRKIRNGPCQCRYKESCNSQNTILEKNFKLNISEEEASILEYKHVHQVYEKIADHFSDTRHSCWPKVVDFINTLPNNSLVLDCGCGNGKYLHTRKEELFMVGCDRSVNLCNICRSKNHQVFVGDALALPFRDSYFDAAISIAVIHHLANENRRLEAIKELVRVIRPGGLCLVYVWAMEQKRNNVKSKYLKPDHKQIFNNENGRVDISKHDVDDAYAGNESNISKSGNGDATNMQVQMRNIDTGSVDCVVPNNMASSKLLNSDIDSARYSLGIEYTTEQQFLSGNVQLRAVHKKTAHHDTSKNLCGATLDNNEEQQRQRADFGGSNMSRNYRGVIKDNKTEMKLYCTKLPIKDYVGLIASHIVEEIKMPTDEIDNDKFAKSQTVNVTKSPTDNKANTQLVESHVEAHQKLPTHNNRTEFQSQDLFVPWHNNSTIDRAVDDIEKRFYHVFKAYELVEICDKLSNLLKVVDCYYDQGNWCVILKKK